MTHAELDSLLARLEHCDHSVWSCEHRTAAAAIRELRARDAMWEDHYKALQASSKMIADERDALRADAERLDYIERNFHVLGFTLGDTWLKLAPPGSPRIRYPSLRAAIDAARK